MTKSNIERKGFLLTYTSGSLTITEEVSVEFKQHQK